MNSDFDAPSSSRFDAGLESDVGDRWRISMSAAISFSQAPLVYSALRVGSVDVGYWIDPTLILFPPGGFWAVRDTEFTVTGISQPYTWEATGIPSGLSLDSSTGILTGTPSAAGDYLLTVQVVRGWTVLLQRELALKIYPKFFVDVSHPWFSDPWLGGAYTLGWDGWLKASGWENRPSLPVTFWGASLVVLTAGGGPNTFEVGTGVFGARWRKTNTDLSPIGTYVLEQTFGSIGDPEEIPGVITVT